MPGHTRRLGLVVLAALLGVGGLAVIGLQPAGADQIGNDQAQAKALQAQIAANNEQIDALGQQADGAQVRLEQAQTTLASDQVNLATTERDLTRIRGLVRARAVASYEAALSGEQFQSLDFADAQRLLIAQKYTATQAAADTALTHSLTATQDQLSQQQSDATKASAQAATDRQDLDAVKANLQTINAEQQQTLSQVQGQLVALVQQQQDAIGASDGGDPSAYPNLPPVSPLAAQAIAFARAQLGKPYVYAAAGPDSYDCSGLVMAAFAFAGYQLPHYSGAQYASLPHIPISAAQPGDLLFWGDAASEHVAIYVGDGRILEAGGTGNDVHIGPIWGQPMGAARVP